MSLTPDHGPTAAIGNLRFTTSGVYADYLLSGLPFIFLPQESQNRVADVHAELLRTLPSGALLHGLTVPVATRNITRRMIYAHPDLHPDTAAAGDPMPGHTEGWVEHCRRWAPALARSRSRRRIHWLSLPLDYGLDGATTAGRWQRRLDSIIGHDKDSDTSVAHYRQVAATMAAKLPSALFAKPATVEQIWWHWNYTASRHTFQQPLPSQPYDPHARLPGSAFTPVWQDPSAAALRARRWRAARTDADIFVRTYRDARDGVPDSYQVIVGLERSPTPACAGRTRRSSRSSTTSPHRTPPWIGRSTSPSTPQKSRSPPPTTSSLTSKTRPANGAGTPTATTSCTANSSQAASWPRPSNRAAPNAASTRRCW